MWYIIIVIFFFISHADTIIFYLQLKDLTVMEKNARPVTV